jgi:hypothetical protein
MVPRGREVVVAVSKELLIQSAVTLLASGRAKEPHEAVALALNVVGELERVIAARGARGGKASGKAPKAPPPLGARARKVLERLSLAKGTGAVAPQELKGKICEAHLLGAKGSGAATVKQIAAWFKAHGEVLPAECALYDANWLTNRCDEKPKESPPFVPKGMRRNFI